MKKNTIRNGIVVAILAALLMSFAAVAIPRPVAAQPLGPWADELIFSIVPQAQSVASVSSGDTDVYIFGLDQVTDVIAARADPNVITYEGVGSGIRTLQLNPVPHAAGVTGFNPFSIREIREAMQWAVDRAVVVNDIYGGFGLPMWTPFHSLEPEYVRNVAFFTTMENLYAFNPSKALDVVTSAMSKVPGSQLVAGKWQVNNEPVVVKIFQRTGDPRFEVGIYAATVVDGLGFSAQLIPGDFDAALAGPLFGDPTIGFWHIYTGGWGGGTFVQFDDTTAPFFYNGDLGVSLWDFYTPPPSLTIPCDRLEDSEYADLDERSELQKKCVTEGVRDSIRVFMKADSEAVLSHKDTTAPTFNLFTAFTNSFSMKTARKLDAVGGTIRIGQPIHTSSAWNAWGGFTDVYSSHQQLMMEDPGTTDHPHLGTTIPFRSEFEITTIGSIGGMDVNASALEWNMANNSFEPVGSGLLSRSFVDYTFNWGSWHHGEAITMDDVKAGLAMFFRFLDPAGDLGAVSPSVADISSYVVFDDTFRGVQFLDADTVRVWIDAWNPDTSLIADRGSIWPAYPWELNAVMARSALANETSFHDSDANAVNNPKLDLVKGTAGLAFLSQALTDLKAVNFKPLGMESDITDAEATARWAALEAWWLAKGHLLVTNGPFFVDSVSTDPEGTVMKAFRTGYPFDVNKWDAFAVIRKPDVAFAAAPEVIQTFPASFGFTTTLDGAPYDLINQANWLVSDPGTNTVLFTGDAVRTGAGAWAAVLSAEQTTALVEGSYTLKTIVVGAEAAVPVVSDLTFTSLSLATAIIADVTESVNTQLGQFEDTIASNAEVADSAVAAANAAINLAYVVLAVAIVGIVVAVVAVALVMRRGGS